MLTIEDIAKVCHQANKSYCETLGDTSQLDWEESPQWQRDSAIAGVEFVLSEPEAPASASHLSWLREKIKDGWRYGPVKNPDTKEHPCMVPFLCLPKAQQMKDHLFKAVAVSLIPMLKENK